MSSGSNLNRLTENNPLIPDRAHLKVLPTAAPPAGRLNTTPSIKERLQPIQTQSQGVHTQPLFIKFTHRNSLSSSHKCFGYRPPVYCPLAVSLSSGKTGGFPLFFRVAGSLFPEGSDNRMGLSVWTIRDHWS